MICTRDNRHTISASTRPHRRQAPSLCLAHAAAPCRTSFGRGWQSRRFPNCRASNECAGQRSHKPWQPKTSTVRILGCIWGDLSVAEIQRCPNLCWGTTSGRPCSSNVDWVMMHMTPAVALKMRAHAQITRVREATPHRATLQGTMPPRGVHPRRHARFHEHVRTCTPGVRGRAH